jgi:hypothetical protein
MKKLRTSLPSLPKAQQRITGLRSIDAELDFGNDYSINTYQAAIDRAQLSLTTYNNALLVLAEAKTALEAADKDLADINQQMLTLVAGRYGKDSIEYKKGGGVRTSERKRPKARNGINKPQVNAPQPILDTPTNPAIAQPNRTLATSPSLTTAIGETNGKTASLN